MFSFFLLLSNKSNWRFPGHLPGALEGCRREAAAATADQNWRFGFSAPFLMCTVLSKNSGKTNFLTRFLLLHHTWVPEGFRQSRQALVSISSQRLHWDILENNRSKQEEGPCPVQPSKRKGHRGVSLNLIFIGTAIHLYFRNKSKTLIFLERE